MGQNKDIGKFFEKKLGAGKKVPTESLWEKITTTLEEERRRKKRALFYWWLGGGISVLVGLLWLFGIKEMSEDAKIPLENNTVEVNSTPHSNEQNSKTTYLPSVTDSIESKTKPEEKLQKIEIQAKDSIVTPTKNSSGKTSTVTKKGKSIDETYTVSKKYYYYNSKDGKQVITSNKNEIDSLVADQYKNIDTNSVQKKDSIRQ